VEVPGWPPATAGGAQPQALRAVIVVVGIAAIVKLVI
jgi:hypothetical protein